MQILLTKEACTHAGKRIMYILKVTSSKCSLFVVDAQEHRILAKKKKIIPYQEAHSIFFPAQIILDLVRKG